MLMMEALHKRDMLAEIREFSLKTNILSRRSYDLRRMCRGDKKTPEQYSAPE